MQAVATRLLLTGLTLLFVAASVQADDSEKAQAIVDRAIKAMGGPAALKKQTRTQVEDKGTFHGMGGEGLPYTGRFTMHWPGRFRMEIVDVFTIVNSGKEVWVSSMGNTIDVTGDPLKYQHEELEAGYLSTLIPLAKPNPKYELSLFGTEDVDGEACEGVNVKRGDRPVVTILFSRKTGLMKKLQTVVHSQENNYAEVVEASVYSDHKSIDGVMVPMKTAITRDGKKYVMSETTKVTFPDELDKALFEKP